MLQAYLERTTAGGFHLIPVHMYLLVHLCKILASQHQIGHCTIYSVSLFVNKLDMEAALSNNEANDTQGFELSPEARAQADLKFTYVVTCQIYGKQKEDQKPEAADIALLMQRLSY